MIAVASEKIQLTFPDGAKKEFKKGITGIEVAKSIGRRLAEDALAVKLNGKQKDLSALLNEGGSFEVLTWNSKEGKSVFWHSASHLMTQAVLRVFKGQNIGLGVGTAIDDGFYQDYDLKELHPEDLEKIEKEMQKIVNEKLRVTQRDVPKKDALNFYKKDPYKTELVNAVAGEKVSMYSQGEFDNLCKGPHVPNMDYISAFKLTKIAGAYWRGDSKNKMLTRIYGIAFPEKKLLDAWLHLIEEADKRNHLKLGKEMDLFSMQPEAPGCVFMHPKGMVIWNDLIDFWRQEHFRRGYSEISTPLILKKDLWIRSGHWDHYRNNMYFTKIDEEDFAVKPMNCPGGMLVYKTKRHSYRELPIRMAELGTVHRHELSGVLNGLFRVRKFTQDDAHIFCTPEQVEKEVMGVIELIDFIYRAIGFRDYNVELSTRPEKAMGSLEQWNKAESALKHALEGKGIKYKINPGDGAFYGPKIDFHVKDALGRTWQCATIQLDFQMPEKFGLKYIGADDNEHVPAMIHRVIFGSIERLIGILIEHFGGKFPLWLAPVQVKVVPVSEKFNAFAAKVLAQLREKGIRAELDERNETVSHKIRDAQLEKVPLIAVAGEKEQKDGTVNVRDREGKQRELKLDEFVADLLKKIREKA
ncbi:MAG: threonine--tRNA ligase [Candidatus Diapherotrites archaeon]